MGNHDSGPDDWWRFDRGYAVAVGSVIAGADSDEGGHLFQSDPGHHSNLMAAR